MEYILEGSGRNQVVKKQLPNLKECKEKRFGLR